MEEKPEKRSRKFQRHHDAIAQILWKEWDPIGLNQMREARDDEYDGYVWSVYKLLLRRPPAHIIAESLQALAKANMGITGDETRTQRAAGLLADLSKEIPG